MRALLIDVLTRTLAWRQRNRRYRFEFTPLKVNLGSGIFVAPGWVNVDVGLYALLRRLPRPILRRLYAQSAWKSWFDEDQYLRTLKDNRFIQHDVRNGIPFADNSIDFLFTSHFLDCLTEVEGRQLFAGAYRALKPGGFIRVSVSDLERDVDLYRKGRKREAIARFFPVSDSPANRRSTIYDFEMLAAALEDAGFIDITRRNLGEGRVPDVAVLDNRPDESLFVEATKPLKKEEPAA
jgi:predicted SAM-dependent methyltransferase